MLRFFNIILSLSFLFLLNTFAQDKIDSLKSALQRLPFSVERLSVEMELVRQLMLKGEDTPQQYFDDISKLLERFPDSLKQAEFERYLGNFFMKKGEYNSAASHFLNSIAIAVAEGATDLERLALNNLATLNIRTKNYEKGIEIFERLLSEAEKENDSSQITMYTMNLAVAYGEAGDFNNAEKYLLRIYNSDIENKFYKAVVANNLSFIYNNNGNYGKALKYVNASRKLTPKGADKAFIIEQLTNYSNALKGLKRNVEAGRIMLQIINLAKEANLIRIMNNAVGNLALNYADLGDYKSAYKYYKDFAERRDSLLSADTRAQLNELQIKYETAEKDRLIQEKNNTIERKNFALTVAISGGILFLLIASIVFMMYRSKQQAYEELVRKNLEIIENEERTFNRGNLHTENIIHKYESSPLSDEKKEQINYELLQIINKEKVFLQSDITLGKLAQKLNVNSKYLSQVIHEYYKLSFADYINRLRIKEAAKLLSDKTYNHISMEGISELVGFSSKSSFNSYFKKFMGVTPSFFMKSSQNLAEK